MLEREAREMGHTEPTGVPDDRPREDDRNDHAA